MFLRCSARKKDGKEHHYWSLVENRRVAEGRVVQRHVLYLGEINDEQQVAWRRSIEIFDQGEKMARTVALVAAERQIEQDDRAIVHIRVDEMELRRPRQWGGCWLACELYHQLELDQFFSQRLAPSRKGTRWDLILQTLVCYRLLDPGSEWRLHEEDQQKIQQLQQQVGETQKAATEAQQNAETASEMKLKLGQLEEQVGETQKTATEAQQKAEAAAQVQPVAPVPSGALATHNFTLAGDAEVQFGKIAGQHGAFTLADYAPVFLYRAGDNVLFEAGFDVTLQNGAVTLANGQTGNSGTQTSIDLSFATIDYLLNDYVTVVAGNMLLPLGTYSERSAGWLNLIPDDPLPRAVLPPSGIGAQLRGSIPVGQSGQQVTYSLYGTNGPGSVDGTGNATFVDSSGNVLPNLDFGNVGIQSNGTTANEHAAVSGGGRIGWFFPLKPNYDLELGISGESGPWNNQGNQLWSAIVADAALHISPYFELKGEYINTWWQTSNMGTLAPRGWWIQPAFKLAALNQNLNLPFINNLELVSRFDWVDDGLGTRTQRETVGYVYYLTNTLLLEGDYEWLHSVGPAKVPNSKYVFQLSLGF